MEHREPESPTTLRYAFPTASEAVTLSRALVEGTRDDVLVADPEGRIQFISPGLARAAGSSPEALAGEPADRALSVMELPSFSNLKGMLATVSSARTEAELVDETGERRKVLLRGVATRSAAVPSRYVWFVTPLSRVRTYEWAHRLVRSELQTQSRILALVSHELRTPLNIILAQLALLQEGLRGELEPGQEECVARASRAGQELLGQVNDLIDLANLESGRVEARPEPLTPARLAELAREVARTALEGRGLPWDVVEELPGDAQVLADPERTGQILSKLLSNARKFTEDPAEGVRITLAARELAPGQVPGAEDGPDDVGEDEAGGGGGGGTDGGSRTFAAVDVRDAGVGIPESERERLFEPFQQGGDVLGRRAGGSGLGLSIARRLARLQDGDLTLHSSSPTGTIFRLLLPLAG